MPALFPSTASCCPATHTMETVVLARRIPSRTVRGSYTTKRAKRIQHWIIRTPVCEENIVASFWHWSDQEIGKMATDVLQDLLQPG